MPGKYDDLRGAFLQIGNEEIELEKVLQITKKHGLPYIKAVDTHGCILEIYNSWTLIVETPQWDKEEHKKP